jgi:hypothetical protein
MNRNMKTSAFTQLIAYAIVVAGAVRALLFVIIILAVATSETLAFQKKQSLKEIAKTLLDEGSVIVKSPPKLGSNSNVFKHAGGIQIVHVPEYIYVSFDFDSEWDAVELPKHVVAAVRAQLEIELNRKFLGPQVLRNHPLDTVFDQFEKEVAEAWDQNKFKEFLADSVEILRSRIKEAIEAEIIFVRVDEVSKEFHGTVATVSSTAEHETFSVTVLTSPPGGKVSVVPKTEYLIAKGANQPIPWKEVVQQPLSVSGVLRYKVEWPDGTTSEKDTNRITKSGPITLH